MVEAATVNRGGLTRRSRFDMPATTMIFEKVILKSKVWLGVVSPVVDVGVGAGEKSVGGGSLEFDYGDGGSLSLDSSPTKKPPGPTKASSTKKITAMTTMTAATTTMTPTPRLFPPAQISYIHHLAGRHRNHEKRRKRQPATPTTTTTILPNLSGWRTARKGEIFSGCTMAQNRKKTQK